METKLWQKDKIETPSWLEEFTIGSDKLLDLLLAEHDISGSKAHAAMLAKTGLISKEENEQLQKELGNILLQIKTGTFQIEDHVEDIHSQIELLLTRTLGNTGKKIHTARSRNDQVLTCIKLFIKDELKRTSFLLKDLFDLLQILSEKHRSVLMPGYTHLQIAMPSSFGLWFGAYAESLSDDMEIMIAAYKIADKNPLGSAAGYGSSLPVDRTFTAEKMGFSTLNYNVVYAQMTRGKTEKITAMALANIAATLARLSMDICLFNSQNFGFISFPEELTTGSSIMPHKRNPDVFELIRGKCNKLQALPNELSLLLTNLPSGYHRELQLTKESLFPAFHTLNKCIEAALFMLKHIRVTGGLLEDPKYKDLFTVEKVNELVKSGIPFREAYKTVGAAVREGTFEYHGELEHTHEGSIGNLMTDQIKEAFYEKLVFLGISGPLGG